MGCVSLVDKTSIKRIKYLSAHVVNLYSRIFKILCLCVIQGFAVQNIFYSLNTLALGTSFVIKSAVG